MTNFYRKFICFTTANVIEGKSFFCADQSSY